MVLTNEGDYLVTGGRRILDEIGELTDTIAARRAVVSRVPSRCGPAGLWPMLYSACGGPVPLYVSGSHPQFDTT